MAFLPTKTGVKKSDEIVISLYKPATILREIAIILRKTVTILREPAAILYKIVIILRKVAIGLHEIAISLREKTTFSREPVALLGLPAGKDRLWGAKVACRRSKVSQLTGFVLS